MTPKKMVGNNDDEEEDYASKLDKIINDLGLEVDEKVIKTEEPETKEPDVSALHPDDDRKVTPEAYEEPPDLSNPVFSPVYINTKALKRMVGYAMRYADADESMKKWREVYGILIGSIEETLTVVKDAIPVCVGGKTGVELEPIHYVDLAQIDASIFERYIEDKRNDFIVGWWHTHPGFGFFFSEVDTYTHLGYQIPNPYAVGLIFDHCERKPDFLGIAGLRLTEPDEGLLSDYRICELHYDDDRTAINLLLDKIIEKVKKNMESVEGDLEYIDKTLRRKKFAQLQRNFGLILVPKRDVKDTHDMEEAEEDEDKLYVWDPDYYKKKYRIPKFREKVEDALKKAEEVLDKYEEKQQLTKMDAKREKFSKKIAKMLEKPNEWLDHLLDEFNERMSKIYEFYDYLDTNERKILENFEERIADYATILEELNQRVRFREYGVQVPFAE